MSAAICVVMSVYNGAQYLSVAIESILGQTFKDFEFIIVDDGSTDESLDVIRSYRDPRIRVIAQANCGLSASLNRGISSSTSRYIARMDADDIAHPSRLAAEFNFLEATPSCDVVGSNANFVDDEGRFLYTSRCLTSWTDIRSVLPKSPFFHSSVMFRRSAFETAGGYLEPISQLFEDQVLWVAMSRLGELRNLDDALIDYRIARGSITSSRAKARELNAIRKRILDSGSVTKEDELALSRVRSMKLPAKSRLAGYYLRIGKIHLEHAFDRRRAIRNILRSLSIQPVQVASWFNLVLACMPRALIKKWKASRGVYSYVW